MDVPPVTLDANYHHRVSANRDPDPMLNIISSSQDSHELMLEPIGKNLLLFVLSSIIGQK